MKKLAEEIDALYNKNRIIEALEKLNPEDKKEVISQLKKLLGKEPKEESLRSKISDSIRFGADNNEYDYETAGKILSLIREEVEKLKKSENSRDYNFGGDNFKDRQHNEMRGMDKVFGYNQAIEDLDKLLK